MRVVFRCDPALRDMLPPPVPARDALPEWLRAMAPRAASELHGGEAVRTVKQCPPFIDAMMHGFIVPLPCDVHVKSGRLSWDWDIPPLAAALHPRSPISFHTPAQLEGTPLHRPGQVAVKFNSFWTIELEPGWSLLATHPLNRDDLPFRLLTGMVDCDRYHDVGILFPAVWTDPGFEGVLRRGTPVAHCIPVQRDPLTLCIDTLGRDEARQYDAAAHALLEAPGHYRRRYRAARSGAGEALAQPGGIEPERADPA